MKEKYYVIGVDGGGTKTVAALADLNGKILKMARTGPSSLRNVGIKTAIDNVTKAIKLVLPKEGKVLSTFIGLPAIEEEYKSKKGIVKKELRKHREISPIFKGKVKIESDQIVAFRAGTNEKEGILLIAGTGCVCHGWREGKEAKVSGWGWLADEGAAFWVGQRAFQAVLKELDGRSQKTLITKMILKNLKVKNKEDLLLKIYSRNPTDIIPKFSVFCDTASEKGDKVAENIMVEAGKELALTVKAVIKKLNFPKIKFPLVLVGSMFKSKVILNFVKKEIKQFAPETDFVLPKTQPVQGAINLALENLRK